MLGRLDFNYFICVYLPGLPICLAVLLIFIGAIEGEPSSILINAHSKWILPGYFLVVPIILGIYIDGIREYFSGRGKEEDGSIFKFGNRIEADDFKGTYSRINYPDPILTRALERYTLFDYVCQFFANMCFSLFLATIIIVIYLFCFYSTLDEIYFKELSLLVIIFLVLTVL